jgi:hypothetical protein
MDYERILLEKMKEEARCPLCGVIEDLEYDQLAHLQHDITEDPNTRARVVDAGGFCAFHFRQFRKLANNWTIALLLDDMITCYLDGRFQSAAECPVCKQTQAYEAELEKGFISHLMNREFHSDYAISNGLCLPHLKTIVEKVDSQQVHELLQNTQSRQLSRLTKSLKNVIAKAYLDTTREERGAIPRAVEKFVGERGIAF